MPRPLSYRVGTTDMGALFLQDMLAGMRSGIGREKLRAQLRESYGRGFSNETYRQMGVNDKLGKEAGSVALTLSPKERIASDLMPRLSVTGERSHIRISGRFSYKATATSAAGSKFLHFNWDGVDAPTRDELEQAAREQHDKGRRAKGTPTQGDFDSVSDVTFTLAESTD